MTFNSICKLSEAGLKARLVKDLNMVSGDGWAYRPGSFPVLLCAHLDTVHAALPRKITNKKGILSSPQGIGGDDRCGVYMILEILKHVDCHVAFFEQEETGGIGSSKFCKSVIAKSINVDFVIELDRRGSNDAVFYDCDNPDFSAFVQSTGFFKQAGGSFTDICHICPVLGIAGVNLSCGYYKAHTKDEYVVWAEMVNLINEIIKLLNSHKPGTVYEWIDKYDSWEYWDDDGWFYGGNAPLEYQITFWDAGERVDIYSGISDYEALGKFFIEHENICFNDILSVKPV